MRKTSLISNEGALLNKIKEIDKRIYIACVITHFTGARYSELKVLTVGDFKNSYINLGNTSSRLRVIPTHPVLREIAEELTARDFRDTNRVLDNKKGRTLRLLEINRVINQAALFLKLEQITLSSFRKTFGHRMCKLLKSEADVISVMGFRSPESLQRSINIYSIFEVERKGIS